MGIWSTLLGRTPVLPIVTPYQPSGDLVAVTVQSLLGDVEIPQAITREIALRVPAVKRAHAVHCGLASSAVFRQEDNGVVDTAQPAWLSKSDSGVSPYLRTVGVVSDLFFYGWALIGAEKGDDDLPVDAMHIPQGLWSTDPITGEIAIDESIPARFHELPIAIPLGLGGMLVDGADTIRAARAIEKAHVDRIENPVAQTELHLTEAVEMTRKEKLKLAKDYNAGRKLPGGATSVTPHNIEVREHGQVSSDLFESGRNAIRLDVANHALVPASIIEGAKNGSAGEINYSNEAGKRNELYDYGTAFYVRAIEARLSMDDVCASGKTIRADLSNLMSVSTPNQSAPSED